MSFINTRRLRDYPRLVLVSAWLILGINLLFHQGWIGAFGQVIGGDFIVFYKTGVIYRSDPALIYDYATQDSVQKSIVSPSIIPSNNPFQNPPFAAPLFALLTYVSLPVSFSIWSFIAILSSIIACYGLSKLVPINFVESGLSYKQLVIITLSFFPFIEGLLAGQNHWLSLLLTTGILITMLKERWYLSGMMAGLLLYKPQFIVGFLILWFIWGKYKALLSFGIVSICWIGIFTLLNGLGLFQTYAQLSQAYLFLPYIQGWPNYLLATFYGLLTSIFPIEQQPIIYLFTQIVFISCGLGLAWFAFKLRKHPIEEQTPVIVAALLFPILATPYVLLHDLVVLIPGFILWARYSSSQNLLYAAIITYIGTFVLTLIGALSKFAWLPLLIIYLVIVMIMWIYSNRNRVLRSN
jgi:hypothetical protein